MSCPKCYYFDFENGEKGDRCPSPRAKFNDCLFYRDKKEKKELKNMLPTVKKLRVKKEEVIPIFKPVLKQIDNVSEIGVRFKYMCPCKNEVQIYADYIGKQKINRICPHCGKTFIYSINIREDDTGDFGFQLKVVINKVKIVKVKKMEE
jgi:hypothetical protein